MPAIQNDSIAFTCDEGGLDLAVIDLRRGVRVAVNYNLDFVGSGQVIILKIVPGAGVQRPKCWRTD